MTFRCWVANCLLALLGVAILATFPSHAQPVCFPLAGLTRQIEAAPVFRILQGQKLAHAISIFNRDRPISDEQWTAAYFFIRPDGAAILFVGIDDVICLGMIVPRDDVQEVIEIIDGVTA